MGVVSLESYLINNEGMNTDYDKKPKSPKASKQIIVRVIKLP